MVGKGGFRRNTWRLVLISFHQCILVYAHSTSTNINTHTKHRYKNVYNNNHTQYQHC